MLITDDIGHTPHRPVMPVKGTGNSRRLKDIVRPTEERWNCPEQGMDPSTNHGHLTRSSGEQVFWNSFSSLINCCHLSYGNHAFRYKFILYFNVKYAILIKLN